MIPRLPIPSNLVCHGPIHKDNLAVSPLAVLVTVHHSKTRAVFSFATYMPRRITKDLCFVAGQDRTTLQCYTPFTDFNYAGRSTPEIEIERERDR